MIDLYIVCNLWNNQCQEVKLVLDLLVGLFGLKGKVCRASFFLSGTALIQHHHYHYHYHYHYYIYENHQIIIDYFDDDDYVVVDDNDLWF